MKCKRYLPGSARIAHTISVVTYRVDALVALADATRRSMVETLRAGPHSVGQLARAVGVSSSAASQHLRVLRDARLVLVRSAGNRRLYSLDPRGLGDVRDYLEQFWPSALASYAAALDEARTASGGPSLSQPTRR
ncbi:ArsR/SmtB family transcription factor [Nocardia paucivorans]|uniref:ArsR/SmtB family transcription factor n=1 Tax=Nocardia paucivorans TaxID=114259 RepID=UPI003571667F